MLTTEDEAKKKWCPHSRRLIELRSVLGNPIQGFSANRTTDDHGLGACLGSSCMAWRWAMELDPDPENLDWKNGSIGTRPSSKGFCGLAGRQ